MAFTPDTSSAPAADDDGQRWAVCDCIECRNGHFGDCPFECRRLIQPDNPEKEKHQ
jgi:hypothetical protein